MALTICLFIIFSTNSIFISFWLLVTLFNMMNSCIMGREHVMLMMEWYQSDLGVRENTRLLIAIISYWLLI